MHEIAKDDFSPLIRHMQRFVSLTAADINLLVRSFAIKRILKKEHVLEEGEVCRHKHFIVKGCLSKYINTESGQKQIFQFSVENWWMTDYTSLESGKPTNCNIQSVENTELISIDKDNLEELYRRIPATETYFRKILQRSFEASLWRIHIIFSSTGEERYHSFVTAFPEFAQRIPQYMLASYLGFTPEFLSKLRAKRS